MILENENEHSKDLENENDRKKIIDESEIYNEISDNSKEGYGSIGDNSLSVI